MQYLQHSKVNSPFNFGKIAKKLAAHQYLAQRDSDISYNGRLFNGNMFTVCKNNYDCCILMPIHTWIAQHYGHICWRVKWKSRCHQQSRIKTWHGVCCCSHRNPVETAWQIHNSWYRGWIFVVMAIREAGALDMVMSVANVALSL